MTCIALQLCALLTAIFGSIVSLSIYLTPTQLITEFIHEKMEVIAIAVVLRKEKLQQTDFIKVYLTLQPGLFPLYYPIFLKYLNDFWF